MGAGSGPTIMIARRDGDVMAFEQPALNSLILFASQSILDTVGGFPYQLGDHDRFILGRAEGLHAMLRGGLGCRSRHTLAVVDRG
jgi:hypothetical protein